MVEITQADREAAAKAAVLVEFRDMIRAGRADHHAEPWAAHREQAERETVERIVALINTLRVEAFDPTNGDAVFWLAQTRRAIERGDWRND